MVSSSLGEGFGQNGVPRAEVRRTEAAAIVYKGSFTWRSQG